MPLLFSLLPPESRDGGGKAGKGSTLAYVVTEAWALLLITRELGLRPAMLGIKRGLAGFWARASV